MVELIKVSAQSRSTAVAGAVAGVMREHGYAEMQGDWCQRGESSNQSGCDRSVDILNKTP